MLYAAPESPEISKGKNCPQLYQLWTASHSKQADRKAHAVRGPSSDRSLAIIRRSIVSPVWGYGQPSLRA